MRIVSGRPIGLCGEIGLVAEKCIGIDTQIGLHVALGAGFAGKSLTFPQELRLCRAAIRRSADTRGASFAILPRR